jgi:hypothetical protein
MSISYVVCCQVDVSTTGRSLVERSPTDCGVSFCDLETSRMRHFWLALGCCTRGRGERQVAKQRQDGKSKVIAQ